MAACGEARPPGARPRRVCGFEGAVEVYGALARRYVDALSRTDPLADAAAEALAASGGRRVLDAALTGSADAPPALRALLVASRGVPPWLERERVELGAFVYRRCGLAMPLTLTAHSLMSGYESAASVKPLAMTGQLEARAPRRVAETGRFITEVVQPHGLEPTGAGFELCIRVRLMHAQVRRMLLRSGRWDTDAWGAPINQADTAFTGVAFSAMMLRGARVLGHGFTDAESEAVMHLWRYVGHLLGLEAPLCEELGSEARANRYEAMARSMFDGPDADSVALAAALRQAAGRAARTPWQRLEARALAPLLDGLAWTLNGEQLSTRLGTPHRSARHLVPVIATLFRPVDRLRRLSPTLERWMAAAGNWDFRRRVAHGLGGTEPSFDPVVRTTGPS